MNKKEVLSIKERIKQAAKKEYEFLEQKNRSIVEEKQNEINKISKEEMRILSRQKKESEAIGYLELMKKSSNNEEKQQYYEMYVKTKSSLAKAEYYGV